MGIAWVENCLLCCTVVLLSGAVKLAEAGVCEDARIPLRTVELDDNSSVCVVPFCGEEEQQRTPNFEDGTIGSVTCMLCDQEAWDGSAEGYREKTDVCPSVLNTCHRGSCCPQKGESTWYNQNFGKDYAGMNTTPHITVTTYGGATACGGTVAQAEAYLKEKLGDIDAIAAVPSMMYGSWMANMRVGSQACYVNNNLCYKITDWQDNEYNIAIWGKCGGYTQCNKEPDAGDPDQSFYSQEVTYVEEHLFFDANKCLNVPGISIATGTTPDCLSVAGGDGTDDQGMNCCPHPCQAHVDWCGSNDHVHFDIGEALYGKICSDLTPCTLKKVEPYLCKWNPPLNPAFENWTPRFSEPVNPGSPEVAPVHDPYPEPLCEDTDPSEAPPPPGDGFTPDCDSVLTANIPAMGDCAMPVCTAYCDMLMAKHCGNATQPDKCVSLGIQSDFCPDDKSCDCKFSTV